MTMSDLGGELREIARAIGRVEGALDRISGDFDTVRTKQNEMERQLNWARGGLAAVGGLFGISSISSISDIVHFLVTKH